MKMCNKSKREILTGKRLMCLFLIASLVSCDLINDSSPTGSKIDYKINTVFKGSGYQRVYPIAFSPNGNQILMSVTKSGGSTHPAIIKTDGSDFRQLTTGPSGLKRKPIGFSPDGLNVLYTFGIDIFAVNTKSSNTVKILDGIVIGKDRLVSFSPDGQSLLFNTYKGDGLGWRINMVDADGSNLRQLTDFYTYAVGFSPDGSKILFYHSVKGEADVWTMDSNGQNQKNLTPDHDPEDVDSPQIPVAFTENGNRILYWDRGSENGIRLMDQDGSNKTVVTKNSPDVPTMSLHNGHIIAFYKAAMTGFCPYCSVAKVGLIRSDGTDRTIFKNDDITYSKIVDSSPDGQSFLLGSSDGKGGNWRVLIVELKN